MKTLNLNNTIEAVREIINSAGADFAYADSEAYEEVGACVYVYGGKPSCIVGRFLVESEGHSVSALGGNEGLNAQGIMDALNYNMRDHETALTAWWLLRLQERQDTHGTTWGDAFDSAQNLAKEWGLSQ